MRVLIIEPDHSTAQSMELMLKSEGWNCYTTDLAEEGLDLARIYDYDLIMMETLLPDMPGLRMLEKIRASKVNTPVMVVSGVQTIDHKVEAFRVGADDYLTKPFHKDEMIARAHAIVRRSKGHASVRIEVGPICVDLDARLVTVDGGKVHLTAKEYQMLELMFLRKGTTLTKENFLNHLYGGMDEPELKIIDVFICKLRKKLVEAGAPNHIETVWGRGYRMSVEPVTKRAALGSQNIVRTGAERLQTVRNRCMVVLGEYGRTLRPDTIALKTNLPVNSVYAVMSQARQQGLVESGGSRGSTSFALTEAGLAFLASCGWVRTVEPEAVAA